MKSQRKSQRKVHSISTSRWTAYAAAAASTFAGAGSSKAEIHYSGEVSVTLTGDAQVTLPLSNGASLVFSNRLWSIFLETFTLVIEGAVSASGRKLYGSNPSIFLSNLAPRKNVAAGNFASIAGNPAHGVLVSNSYDGQFYPDGGSVRGFIGFRFNVGNGMQYGWARIYTKNDSHRRLEDLIKDYAWGDPGDDIVTGQKRSSQSANANSILGSLGLLAFGAQGVEAWRTQSPAKSN